MSVHFGALSRGRQVGILWLCPVRRLFQIRGANDTTLKKKTIQALLSSWRKCETREILNEMSTT